MGSVTKLIGSFAAVLVLTTVLSGAASSIAEQSVAAIMNAPVATNAVWPGFSLPDRDWAVQDETGVYLVTKKTPPDSFTARGRWYFRQEPLPNFTAGFEMNYRLGDLRLVAARARPSVERTVALLYHESFHVFQKTWAGLANPVDYGSIQNLLPAHAAGIEVERRALRDAIRSSGRIEPFAQQALAVRARRASQVSGDFVQAERHAERNEGLAAYVDARSAASALGKSARSAIDDIGRQLGIPMRTFGGSPDERLIRSRAYGTGAAMGLLLDRLGIDWKDRTTSEPLDRLLAEAVGTPEPQAAEAAYRRYGYERLLKESPSPWGALDVMNESAFDRLAPYRLVLDLPPGTQTGYGVSGAAGMHRPAPRILLLPMVTRFSAKNDGVSVVIDERPVKLIRPETDAGRTTVIVLLAEPPALDGKRVVPGLDGVRSDIRLEGRGVTVTIAGTARVVSVSDRITISR